MRTVKAFAKKMMGTDDIRIDVGLNKYIWHKGIRNVPRRVRVKLERHVGVNDEADEDDDVKMYTIVKNVPVDTFKGLLTEEATVDAEEAEADEEEE